MEKSSALVKLAFAVAVSLTQELGVTLNMTVLETVVDTITDKAVKTIAAIAQKKSTVLTPSTTRTTPSVRLARLQPSREEYPDPFLSNTTSLTKTETQAEVHYEQPVSPSASGTAATLETSMPFS